MPNLLSYPIKGIKRKFYNNCLKINKTVSCVIVSPGGCGSVTLIKYLDNNLIKSNIYCLKKFFFFSNAHFYKIPPTFLKNETKVILLYRNINEIYKSLEKRKFLRNALIHFGDVLPFMYLNLFKNKKNLK